MHKKKIPNLTSLRFFAAELVIIQHIEGFRYIYGLRLSEPSGTLAIIGKLGVVLFFVLSGYLITSLLLEEINKNKKINFKYFFIRRTLRIFPLYFLITFLSFFLFPKFPVLQHPISLEEVTYNNFKSLLLYIFMLPNLAINIDMGIKNAYHLWSIGTEEQFYLLWPFLVAWSKNRYVAILIVIFTYLIVLKTSAFILQSSTAQSLLVFHKFWTHFNIDCMAIGALFALLSKSSWHQVQKMVCNNLIFYLTTSICIILISLGIYIPSFHFEVYALLFGIIIYNLSNNHHTRHLLENASLRHLGEISYGLYMFHPICIVIIINCLKVCGLDNITFLIYILTFTLTYLIARLSYVYYERFFLSLKELYNR